MTEQGAEQNAKLQKLGIENARLRTSHDRLLSAAKGMVAVKFHSDKAWDAMPCLLAAVAKAEELTP